MVLYPAGYHMLTRDLQADVVLQDVVTWIQDTSLPMPSDLEVDMDTPRLWAMCDDV
jgi:hypothetical protein